jgi:hypothetical protein
MQERKGIDRKGRRGREGGENATQKPLTTESTEDTERGRKLGFFTRGTARAFRMTFVAQRLLRCAALVSGGRESRE